mmetsp:Transcript_47604/g.153025  ORF Transcript_47604/g.153025 Transcript_47604/m.153025 type:complete len:449 (+) Transcript_47604:77-1423(+)
MGCTQSSGGCQAGGIEVEVEVEAVAILKEPVTEPVKQELVAQPSKPQKEHDESPSISNHNTCSSLHDSHPGVHDSQDFEGLDEARQSPKQQQDRQQQCGKEEEFGKHLPPEIHNHFKFLGMIGTGSFSQVYAAQTIDDGDDVQSVAVKVIEIKSINTQDCFMEGSYAFLVTEMCDHTLLELLEMHGSRLDGDVLREVLQQIFGGLARVHLAGVVHRDVKPDNFLCNLSQGSDKKAGLSGFQVKLCDFGLSEFVSEGRLRACCGTAPFMSPEMLIRQGYELPTDIWSAGVIMHTLLMGYFPYTPQDASSASMKDMIKLGKEKISFQPKDDLLEKGRPIPRAICGALPLMKSVLDRDPARRPLAKEVLQHAWFSASRDDGYSFSPCLTAAKLIGAFDIRAAVQRKLSAGCSFANQRGLMEATEIRPLKPSGTLSPQQPEQPLPSTVGTSA